MNDHPYVSAIVLCRNEEKFIGKCLESIIANDYPKDKLEVLVVDGMSEDRTRKIVRKYENEHSFIILINNPKKLTPFAFNTGIKHAHGDVIMIMNAHATYERNYISKCTQYLKDYNADNVGGIVKIVPRNNTLVAKSIAYAFSSPFGAGNAYYRIGSKKPRYVDTVHGGAYKKEVFRKIGLFDEDLVRNQDDEFNFRLIKNGGKILLVPEIVLYFYGGRDSLSKLWQMNYQYGYFKPLAALKVRAIYTIRQLIPSLLVGSLILSGLLSFFSNYFFWLFLIIIVLYFSVSLAYSTSIALKKGLKLLPVLPISFATLHFSYGIGYLKGILDFIVLKKHARKKVKDIPLTR